MYILLILNYFLDSLLLFLCITSAFIIGVGAYPDNSVSQTGRKTVKDFLEENAVFVKFPKDTIKEAFKYEIIENGDMWMDMLEKRNLMSHTYDESLADLAYRLIMNDYYPALKQVYLKLGTEL